MSGPGPAPGPSSDLAVGATTAVSTAPQAGTSSTFQNGQYTTPGQSTVTPESIAAATTATTPPYESLATTTPVTFQYTSTPYTASPTFSSAVYTTSTTPESTISSTSASSTSASSTSTTAAALTATASAAATSTAASASKASTTKWVPGVIVGSIAFVAILAGLAFWLVRRRRNSRKNQKYHPADQFDQSGAPLASPDMFGYRRPLMGMSQVDAERAEQERRDLIRKSMISHSSWSASQADHQFDHPVDRQVDHQHGNQYDNQYGNESQADITAAGVYTSNSTSAGLRDDYKEWDAQMQQQKALLAAQHPSQAEVSQVEVPASRQVSRERLRLDTRNVSPPPASPHQEEAFPVSPVSVVSILPPVPTRSHKRPSSADSADSAHSTRTVTQNNASQESAANALAADPLLPRRPTNQSTRSRMSTRSIARNPHTRHLTEHASEPESPSSLYSVDLQDGRHNTAWANYHHDDAV